MKNKTQLRFTATSSLTFIICVMVLLSLFVACNKSYQEQKQEEKKTLAETLRKDSLALKIATVPTLDCLPLFIGVEDSLFEHNGVDVHLKQRNGQIDCDTLIRGKYVEGIVSGLIRTERLKKEGIALRYLTATNAYWQLYTNHISRIKELKQLSDKMIAMTRYSATNYLADYAIDSARPQYDVFKIQINDPRTRIKMMINNEMDAALFTEPQATTARIYNNPMLMDSRDKNIRFGVIAFRESALKDKRRQKQLKAFTKVYNMAVDSINYYGFGHYAAIIMKYTNADEKTIKALPKLKFNHVNPPRQRDINVAKRY
ncbi:ABC transporter substrate-binding protein [Hallella multisaccharivorax]|uniref:ABC transporter substrate-binding protein n=1 Tax=Hallella multisaccharivorax TaxID=310514 RepID=UPI00361C714A